MECDDSVTSGDWSRLDGGAVDGRPRGLAHESSDVWLWGVAVGGGGAYLRHRAVGLRLETPLFRFHGDPQSLSLLCTYCTVYSE